MTSDRSSDPIIIDIENITKDYVMGEEIVHALRGVSLQILSNEYLAIMAARCTASYAFLRSAPARVSASKID